MGCDAYADENGEIEILVESYDDPYNTRKRTVFSFSGYEPKERLRVEWYKGDTR